jgi:galactose-1-phosphate uridylyltransferase
VKSHTKIDLSTLRELLQLSSIDDLPLSDIAELFRKEINEVRYLPERVYQIDPRSGERILYHTARSKRIHDNLPVSSESAAAVSCVVCEGKTTGIIDMAQLSQGFTFINKNLYPVVYPFKDRSDDFEPRQHTVRGMHFLQWTSSYHNKDWRNMPLEDNTKVMQRLASLERKLVEEAVDSDDGTKKKPSGDTNERHAIIFKNYGHLVGGSLAHGHQQIALSSILPKRFRDDDRFEQERGLKFSEFMLEKRTEELTVRDYGPAVLVVPYFMRRPYDMMLLVKDTSKRHIFELSDSEIEAVAEGWSDGTRAIHKVMPQIGREIAYNVVAHNGPGAGLYFEFLPYTQEIGGIEQLGLIVCQEDPVQAAEYLRESLENG